MRRTRRVVSAFLFACTMTVLAGAVAPSAASAQGGWLSCSFIATEQGFDVSWQSTLDAERYIIERAAGSKYWWRGRSSDDVGQFHDGTAPHRTASMRYQIVAKDSDQQVISTTRCTPTNSAGFSCSAYLDASGYKISWDGAPAGADTDIVVRRQVKSGQTFYWRGVTTDSTWSDALSPTGSATYMAVSRSGKIINAIATCGTGTPPPPPPPAATCTVSGNVVVSDLPQSECDALTALKSINIGGATTIDPCEWDAITCRNGHVHQIHHRLIPTTGPLPAEIGAFTELTGLLIEAAELSGELPPELGQLKQLTNLFVRGNKLTGDIPAELGDMTAMEYLDIAWNELSGPIPVELTNLANLDVLWANNNNLSGELSPLLSELKAQAFSFSDNNLSGSIPASFGSIAATQISLGYNQLSGELPVELANLTNLSVFDVGSNQLEGDITEVMAGIIDEVTFLYLHSRFDDNCFFVTDVDLAAQIAVLDPDWDECNANGL